MYIAIQNHRLDFHH